MQKQFAKDTIPEDNIEVIMLLGGLFKRVSTEYKRKYYFCGIQIYSKQVSNLKMIRSEIEKLHFSETITKIENLIKQTTEQFSSETQKNSKHITTIVEELSCLVEQYKQQHSDELKNLKVEINDNISSETNELKELLDNKSDELYHEDQKLNQKIDNIKDSLELSNKDLCKKIADVEIQAINLNQLSEEKINLLQQDNLSIKQDIKSEYQKMNQQVSVVDSKMIDINNKVEIVNQFVKTASTIKFNDDSLPLMKYGFYNVEPWGSWLHKHAMLFIKTMSTQTDVELTFMLNCFHVETEKTLCIYANGTEIGKYTTSQGSNTVNITIPKFNIPQNGFISLEFITDKVESPQDIFDSQDSRLLGFGLIEMTSNTAIILFGLDKDLFHALYQQRYLCHFKNEEWEEYFRTHDIEQKLLALKQDMSDDSQILVDEFYKRRCNSYIFSAYEAQQRDLVLAKDISKYQIVNQTGFQPEVFYFKNGLKFIDDKVIKKHLTGRDVIDGGACSGDSALMFAEHDFINKIYSFEPMQESYEGLKKTLEINNCHKAEAVHQALGEQDETIEIMGETCRTITIDTFAKDKKIGCIKFDLEGMEFCALKGAERTIKRDKPLLLICLYHTPKDFFEIKPLIESWNLGYKFKIVDTEPCSDSIGIHVMLIAYQG